ncbi:MAG: Ldh family oxidoreductase [Candidatus Methylomirabilota bacterium]|jgi:LDH2 family malate/lactate/ureidoglycolate dehydrogenase
MLTFPADYLERVYAAMARQFGASDDEAMVFSRHRLTADLRGKDTQGIASLPLAYRKLRSGAARFGVSIKVVKEGPGFAIVDGDHGLGQIVSTRAMKIAIEKAQRSGVAGAWVRHTNDFGMAGYYAMLALDHGCIGVVMSNGIPLVAPWGGRDALFGTNPICIAIPANQEFPIVIDMSASAVSHGKVVLAARDGKRLEGPLLVDEGGRVTDDPVPFIVDASDRDSPQRGAILAMGPKGFGWLLFVDVLAGILSGMTSSQDVSPSPTAQTPSTIGHFLMAIDVGALMPLSEFTTKVDDLIRGVKGSRLAEGFAEIVLPGERAAREEERRRREGIPIREEDWRNVVAIARELDLDLEALRSAV